MKNLTVNRLKKLNACTNAIAVFQAQSERDPVKLIREMIETKQHLDWASWLIIRLMSKRQAVQYAVYAASQVLDIFEKEYPDDKRPREAIEAARTWIKRPTKKNRNAARAAAGASHAASAYYAAWATASAARAAAWAACYTTARLTTAVYAAATADSASYATYATYAAASAYTAASDSDTMLVKILKYGLKLLHESRK